MGQEQSLFFGPAEQCGSEFIAPQVLAPDAEQPYVAQLMERVPQDWLSANKELVDFMVLSCLRFRKYDIDSAWERLESYFKWRSESLKNGLGPQDVSEGSTIRIFLSLGVVRLLPHPTPQGHAILNMRFCRTRPDLFDAEQVTESIHWIMLKAIARNPLVAAAGFVLVNDIHGAGMKNLDRELPKRVLKMVTKNIPIRLAGIFLCRPNFMVSIVVPLVKLLMSSKMAARLKIVSDLSELQSSYGIGRHLIPEELHGSLEGLADNCVALCYQEVEEDGSAGADGLGSNHCDELSLSLSLSNGS